MSALTSTTTRTRRKTADIRSLVIELNRRILACPDLHGRQALCSFTESLLMDHNVYAGFGYVNEGGAFVAPEEIQAPGWTDVYRRSYYLHSKIARIYTSIRPSE